MTRLVAVWLAFGLALLAVGPSAPFAPQVITPGPLSGVGLTVTITVPTSATTYDAGTSSTIAVSGTAQSDRTVTGCTYTNSLGGSGSTTGTTSWSIASVALTVGSNVLTVTCTNVEGSVNFDVLTITRSSSGGGCVGTAPQICTETGTLTNGSSVVIGGSGFGTKTTVTPYLYETYESGSFQPQWADPWGSIVSTAGKQRHSFSTRNVHADFTPGPSATGALDSGTTSRFWYVEFWLMFDTTWKWPTSCTAGSTSRANLKFIVRMWSPADSGDSSTFFQEHSGSCVGFGGDYNECGVGSDDPNFDVRDFTLGTWHQYEVQYTDSSGNGTFDGAVKLWIDGTLKLDVSSRKLKCNGNFAKRPWHYGLYDSWGGSNGVAPNDVYMDDAYADTGGFSRVYIADGSTFATRGHSELQKPTAWSATSITIQVFQGSHTSLAGKYLYVCDSTGTCNSAGFPL